MLGTMALLGASLGLSIGVAVETAAPAGAAGTVVVAGTFHNANVTSPAHG